MKKLIFSNFKPLIAFAILFFTLSLAFAQDCPPPADPDSVGKCCTVQQTTTVVSPLSELYPDCKLSVTYTFEQCVKGNVTTVRIFDYQIDPNGSSDGCEDLIRGLGNTSLAGQQFLRDFNISIGRQLQDDVATKFILNSGLAATFSCTNVTAQKIVNIDYYQSGCISFVSGEFTLQQGVKKVIFKQVPCNSTACCGFRRVYCYDKKTNSLKFEESGLAL